MNVSVLASSMKSWSYQSTNPCTVLVKEKQDGQSSSSCPPHLLQASTEATALPHDQPDSSSLGNIVGGKKVRQKRQAHEDDIAGVVFDEIGKDSEPMHESVEKRILVNISIAMDRGKDTVHQEVYNLQVAVPLPKKMKTEKQFYSYDIDGANEGFLKVEPQKLTELNADDQVFASTLTNDQSTTPTSEDFSSTSSSGEGLRIY